MWRPSAERKLTELWLNGADRQAATDAADAINALLRDKPLDVGESRDEIARILTVLPRSVYYDVHNQDRLVAVWAVWRVRSS